MLSQACYWLVLALDFVTQSSAIDTTAVKLEP